MKFVNPELNTNTLYKAPELVVKEKMREIICDKYGFEGDCTLQEMIDDLYNAILTIKIN